MKLSRTGLSSAPAAAKAALGSQESSKLRESESEARQNLWRTIVLILLVLLAAESWLTSRPPKSDPQTAPAVPS